MVKEEKQEKLAVANVKFNSYNPNVMSPEKFKELKDSIKRDGLQQPILVRRLEGANEFEVIDGEHRLRAGRELGLKHMDIVVRDVDEDTAMRLCYQINEARGQLDLFKQAKFFEDLAPRFEDYANVAKDYGLSTDFVADRIAVAHLTQEDIERLQKITPKDVVLTAPHWIVYADLSPEERIELGKQVKTSYVEWTFAGFKELAREAKKEVKELKEFKASLEKSKYPDCPKCKGKAVKKSWREGEVTCSKDHEWSLKDGKIHQERLTVYNEATGESRSNEKQKFPRTLNVDVGFDAAVKTIFSKVMANVKDLECIKFEGKDGLFYEFNFVDLTFNGKGAKKLYVKKGKDHNGQELILVDDDGKKKIELKAFHLTKKTDDEAREWVKFLGGNVVERVKKEKMKGSKGAMPPAFVKMVKTK